MPFVETSSNKTYFSRIEDCFQKLKFVDKISLKMEKLSELSSLTPQDYKMRHQLRNYIHTLLKNYYPHCEVHIYGSSTNGFGTTGCDIDLLFLPHPGYFRLGTEKDDVEDELLPSLEQVENGNVRTSDLLQMGEKFQLLFAMRVFKTDRRRFHRVVFIPAKCPIINFIFIWKGSEYFCDLSCRNRLVLHNTELLKNFGMVDSRVRPLVSTLRYWAKCLKHVQALNFSTYAFTLMVIFFLQSINPPVLPSVDYLMDVAGSSMVTAECKVGYEYDIKKVPISKNLSSNEELFGQFFDYYWNFDFNKNIICVRTGSALPIKCIEETFQDRCKDFEISAVCVQDPFKLSHNVSRNVKHNGLRNFKLTSLIASNILKNIILSPFKYKFDELFQEKNYKDVISNYNSVSSERSISIIIDLDYEINLRLENAKRSWYCTLSDAVFKILNKGLLFDCEVIDRMKNFHENNNLHSKNQYSASCEDVFKNCTLKDADSILAIQCAVYSRTWTTRKTVTAELLLLNEKEFSDVFEKEEYVSKCIAADPLLSNSTPIFWFTCDCYESKFPQIPCLMIELTPLTQSKEFKSMANFLSNFIPKTLHTFFAE